MIQLTTSLWLDWSQPADIRPVTSGRRETQLVLEGLGTNSPLDHLDTVAVRPKVAGGLKQTSTVIHTLTHTLSSHWHFPLTQSRFLCSLTALLQCFVYSSHSIFHRLFGFCAAVSCCCTNPTSPLGSIKFHLIYL